LVGKASLDIKDEMRAVDLRDKTFYDRLTPEEKKKFSMYILVRWASLVEGVLNRNSRTPKSNTMWQQWYIEETNRSVNKNFYVLAKHPKLLWLMFSQIGGGQVMYHEWVPRTQDKADKVLDMLGVLYPTTKLRDLQLLKETLTPEDIKKLTNEYNEFKSDFNRE